MLFGFALCLFTSQFLTLLLCFQFTQGLGTLIFKVAEFERELQILVGILLTLRFHLLDPCVNGIGHAPFLMVVHIGSILRCEIEVAQCRNAVTDSRDDTLGLLPALTLLALFLGFGAVTLCVHPVLNGLDLAVSACGSVNALLLFGRYGRRFVFGVGGRRGLRVCHIDNTALNNLACVLGVIGCALTGHYIIAYIFHSSRLFFGCGRRYRRLFGHGRLPLPEIIRMC